MVADGVTPARPNEFSKGSEGYSKLWLLVTRCFQQEPSQRPSARDLIEDMKIITVSFGTRAGANPTEPVTRPSITSPTSPLEPSVSGHRPVLNPESAGGPTRARALTRLGFNLIPDFFEMTHPNILDEAITRLREALSLYPAGNVDRWETLDILGYALGFRSTFNNSIALVDEALALHREALGLIPDGHLGYMTVLVNLANALGRRAALTVDRATCEEAVAIHHKILALVPLTHPDYAEALSGLGDAVLEQGRIMNDMALIDEAVGLLRQAVESCPARFPMRAVFLVHLSMALWDRAGCVSDASDEHPRFFLAAVNAAWMDSQERRMLANRLWRMYRAWGDAGALNEAVAMYEAALATLPPDHAACAVFAEELAATVEERERLNRTGRGASIPAHAGSAPRRTEDMLRHL
jgi:tetratricopeptide (TPR) repeat protein